MFDFYFTGVAVNSPIADYLIKQPGACILLSQLNERSNISKWIERLKKEKPESLKLFIDSGAFSAWTKGKKIDVDEYISFINSNKDYFSKIFIKTRIILKKRHHTPHESCCFSGFSFPLTLSSCES